MCKSICNTRGKKTSICESTCNTRGGNLYVNLFVTHEGKSICESMCNARGKYMCKLEVHSSASWGTGQIQI